MLTRSALRAVLRYDPATGIFTWRHKTGNRVAGTVAGYNEETGYVRIRVNTVSHYAHRLAWLYVHGTRPRRVQHRNRDKRDNRIDNLYKWSKPQ